MAKNLIGIIKSAIFVPEEDKQEPAAVPPVQSAPTQQPTVASYTPQAQPIQSQPTPPVHDFRQSDIMGKLCDRLENEVMSGPGYMELCKSVRDEDLASMMPDIEKRFVFVFKTLVKSTSNISKSSILASLDAYISCLKNWEQEGLAEITARRNTVQAQTEKVAQMRTEIQRLEDEIKNITSSISSVTDKCDTDEYNMTQSVAYLINGLNDDRQVIERVIN